MSVSFERVVVTGMGVASPLGSELESFWGGLLEGRSGVVDLEDEQLAKLPVHIGALVKDFDPRELLGVRATRRMNRSSQFALVAAKEAIEGACLTESGINREEVAVIIGSSIGGFSASDPVFGNYYLKGRSHPLVIPNSMNSGPSANVSMKYGYLGPTMTVDAACSTAAHSIAYVYNLIRTGMLEIGVTGAADSPFAPAVMAAWIALRALSARNDDPARACRPFSADRDGLVLGEGAGILILESETSARGRGAQILAEIKGYGASSDGHHLTQPTVDGPTRAMAKALDDAHLEPNQIDYINAHATGTQWNDGNETSAIKNVFNAHAYEIPIVGNKAALGHSIAAGGALEMIGCILSLRDQVVPPTINYTTPDPECDLDYVLDGRREYELENIMSNSFAFGGSNAALVVGTYAA